MFIDHKDKKLVPSILQLKLDDGDADDVFLPRTCVWCVGVLALVRRAVSLPALSVASATIHFVSALR